MDWSFLLQILILLGAAVALGAVAERLRQSMIVGFLLAGMAVAPWIESRELVAGLAELGVALLLFSIGLEFSWQKLKRLGSAALLGGFFQIALTMLGFAAVVFGLRGSVGQAAVVGGAAALSSTAVVLRTLGSRGEIDSVHGRMSLGILLLQDIAVVPLVLLIDSLSPPPPEVNRRQAQAPSCWCWSKSCSLRRCWWGRLFWWRVMCCRGSRARVR